MKTLGLQIAVLLVLAGSNAQAFPPRKHSESGTVAAFDVKAQTITLQVCCETRQFEWRDWTRIRIRGQRVKAEEIRVGTPVRVSYRHELGKAALYEVRSMAAGSTSE